MKKICNRMISFLLVMLMLLAMVPAALATENQDNGWVDPIPAERIICDFRAADFYLPRAETAGDAIVEDPDSPFGQAARFSYEVRKSANEQDWLDSMQFLGDNMMKLRVYNTNSASDREILAISQSQLRANSQNGQYLMYHAEDVDLFPTDGNYLMYMFDCWSFQIGQSAENVEALKGQPVDIYMSLKVTGDIASAEGNTPCYYIDRVVIATAEEGSEEHEHSVGAWKAANDYSHEAMCQIPGCSTVLTEDHTWDEGVVTKEPTEDEVGIQTYTCSLCGATRTKKLAQVSSSADKAGQDNEQGLPAAMNMIWIFGGIFAAAMIVILVALIMKKKGKK